MSQPVDKHPGKSFHNSLMDSMGSYESKLDDTIESPRPASESSVKFAPPLEPGDIGKLGKYRIVKQLGRGGMGVVYLAHDTLLNRKLALKIMHPNFAAERAAKERFLREARATAQINHDNVVTIYEADERDGVSFIAMQYLEGCTLHAYLSKNGIPTMAQALRLMRETATGLAAAHKIGLVHRDIKPANLWLEAPNGRIKVLDFGLAKPLDAEIEVTRSGIVVGTPAYMSLEQGRAQKVDHRTDLFSLGVVSYQLCTGKLPFDGPTVMAVLIALGSDEPRPVRELNPQVPVTLAELIHQLLSKNPVDRPATAEEVIKRMNAIAEQLRPGASESEVTEAESVVVEENAVPKPVRYKPRSTRTWVAVGFASLLAAVFIGVVIIIIKNKDGTETKIEVPDDATVSVIKDGKEVAQVKPSAVKPNDKQLVAAPSDRKGAEYVLSIGGSVKVNGEGHEIRTAHELPKDNFKLTAVNLDGNKNVTDAGLANFKDSRNLAILNLRKTPVSDAGLVHFKDCKNLTELYLDETKLTNAGLMNFKGCKNLIILRLGFTPVTDSGVEVFKDCQKLTLLDLTSTKLTLADLDYFKDCKNLKFLSLAQTPVKDAALGNFKDCKDLVYLDLSGTQITNAGLAFFKDCKKLTSLHLPSTQFTDAGLAYFKDCKNLQRLTLRHNKLTDEGLAYFKDCKNLEGLWVENTGVTDVGLAFYKDCKSLRILNVSDTKITAKYLAEFLQALPQCKLEGDGVGVEPKVVVDADRKAAEYVFLMGGSICVNEEERWIKTRDELPSEPYKLTGVNLTNNMAVNDVGLNTFKNCKSLIYLNLDGTDSSDAGLSNFRDCNNLRILNLSGTRVTDASLQLFKNCKNLTHIALARTSVSDAGMVNFKNCKNLILLFLFDTKVTDEGMANFTDCPELRDLDLSSTKLTDRGMANFKSSRKLRKLDLSATQVGDLGVQIFADCEEFFLLALDGTRVSDEGLANFKKSKNLAIVRLHNTKVTGPGLANFKDCKILGELYLDGTGVTDQSLTQLKDLKDLNLLSLPNTPITDKGLAFIKDITHLKRLYLKNTKVSEKGLQELHQALPQCKIEHDGGTIEPK
jgi:serine/threonine protein kinase/Leucine-rich repeat (LRR) protein